MAQIDENHEAVACIRMAIDAADAELKVLEETDNEYKLQKNTKVVTSQAHWKLGSPEKPSTTKDIETAFQGNPAFQGFQKNLLSFLRSVSPDKSINGPLKVCHNYCAGGITITQLQIIPFKCIYINYQSLENWHVLRDIARCSPSFHDKPRYDCIIINTEPVTYARLCLVFRCYLDSVVFHDISLVRMFKPTKWNPKTLWKNCQVYEESAFGFVMLKYIVRACHMIPSFGGRQGHYYLNDLIDKDMFLRCGN